MKKKVSYLVSALVVFAVPALAFAQEEAGKGGDSNGFGLLAAGLAIGVAALGGALGQSRAAAAALDGIARNPGASDKLFVPMILGLAFIESLVLFGFLIAFLILGKIG